MGQVKTRLAEKIGQHHALRIYHYMLSNIRRLIIDYGKADAFLLYDNYIPCQDNWPDDVFMKFLQSKSPMDEKLLHAFGIAEEMDYTSALWLVADCPRLNIGHIRKAFHLLAENDVVVGPTPDNGIYLLGVNPARAGFIKGMKWGKGTLLRQVIRACEENQLKISTLPELQDVDVQEDLVHLDPNFSHLIKGEGFAPPE